MQEPTQNPQPSNPQDIHWGITYLHQYMQDLREDVRKLIERFDEQNRYVNGRFDAVNERFDAVNERFDAVNERFDAVNERFDEQNRLFDAKIDTKIDACKRELRDDIGALSVRQDSLSQRQDLLLQRQDSHFRWLMGTMITLFVGFGGVVLAAAKF